MKKLLVIGAGLALSAMTVNAFADTLTLINQSPNQVGVACNGAPGLPISADGTLPVTYGQISFLFPPYQGPQNPKCPDQQPNKYVCTFSVGGSSIGQAILCIDNANQNTQVLQYSTSSGYSATINPTDAVSQAVPDILVTLSSK